MVKFEWLKTNVTNIIMDGVSISQENQGSGNGAPTKKEDNNINEDNNAIVEAVKGQDPAPFINSNKVGSSGPSQTPVGKSLSDSGYKNGYLPLDKLVSIGEGASKTYYPDGQYKLHPSAAKAWFKWKKEMDSQGIKYSISSAYRSYKHQKAIGGGGTKSNRGTVASPGGSAHGLGIAIDLGNLYSLVNGSGNPTKNKNARIKYRIYTQIAEIGKKYHFYNPWRLSDSSGTDEIWHFEYWGSDTTPIGQ